jgi:hypothetical protein
VRDQFLAPHPASRFRDSSCKIPDSDRAAADSIALTIREFD